MLDAWDPIKLLDTLPWDKADVYSSRNTDLMEQLLRVPAELADAVRGTEILLKRCVAFFSNHALLGSIVLADNTALMGCL